MIEKLVGAACLFAAAFVAERAWGRRERRALETLDCAIRLLRFFHRQVSTVGRPVGEIWRTVPEEIWCGCTGGMTERHERCLLAAGERFCDGECRRAWEELLREVRGVPRGELAERIRHATERLVARRGQLMREAEKKEAGMRAVCFCAAGVAVIFLW